MLDSTKSLNFPKLKFVRDVKFGSWSGKSEKTTPLYRLDWGGFEQKAQDNHEKWLNQCHKDKYIKLYPSLPEKYDVWLKNLKFAIPYNYKDEIQRNSKRAVEEWNIHRGFDTNIREMCYAPAIAHVLVAFKLVADCTYDVEENYFYRGADSCIVPHAMAYKFWFPQTGRGCVKDHAGFSDLERTLSIKGMGYMEDSMPLIEEFMEAIKNHENGNEKEKSKIYTSEDCEDQPDLC